MDMLKIGILGLTGVMLAIQFKGTRAEDQSVYGSSALYSYFCFFNGKDR